MLDFSQIAVIYANKRWRLDAHHVYFIVASK